MTRHIGMCNALGPDPEHENPNLYHVFKKQVAPFR